MVDLWREELKTDANVEFDRSFTLIINDLSPQVSWGTNPSMVVDVTDNVPYPDEFANGNENERKAALRALEYMGLNQALLSQKSRLIVYSLVHVLTLGYRLIGTSIVVKGKKVSSRVRAMVVPGSQHVKMEAERLGLDKIFKDAGFEWRESGCSMCLGMNPDVLAPGERLAQSIQIVTLKEDKEKPAEPILLVQLWQHVAAIEGHFIDVREWL